MVHPNSCRRFGAKAFVAFRPFAAVPAYVAARPLLRSLQPRARIEAQVTAVSTAMSANCTKRRSPPKIRPRQQTSAACLNRREQRTRHNA